MQDATQVAQRRTGAHEQQAEPAEEPVRYDSPLATLLARKDDQTALCLHQHDREVLRWSFRQLQAARAYGCKILHAAGLRPSDRLLLLCADLPQFIALFMAALDQQLCLLPLHPDQDELALQEIVRKQQPAAVIADTFARGQLQFLRGAIACCFALEPAADAWLCRLQPLVQSAVPAAVPADTAAVVFHSSGSSGRPKAIVYERQRLDTFLQFQRRLFRPFDDEAAAHDGKAPSPRINVLPLTHWGGLSFCLQALLEGRAVHLLNGYSIDAVLPLVQRIGCRLLMLVPSMYRELLPKLEQDCPPCLRYCLTMGEAMPAALGETLRRRHRLLLCTAYGMSEGLSGLAHGAVAWEDMPWGSCGQQAFGELQLVAADGTVQPDQGEASGELWIRNPTVRPCYQDPGLQRERFVDGWYRSGDCLRRDAGGHYFFVSRLDAMCVHNGRNVYPQQIEAVFIEHPAVAACMAAPLQLEDGRRRLGLCLVLHEGLDAAPHELLDFYLQRGAHYAAPAFMLQLDQLPMTASGKPERALVAALLQNAYDHAQQLDGANAAGEALH